MAAERAEWESVLSMFSGLGLRLSTCQKKTVSGVETIITQVNQKLIRTNGNPSLCILYIVV